MDDQEDDPGNNDVVVDRRMNLKIPTFSGKENRGAVAAFILKAQTAIAAAGLENRPVEAAGYFAHALKGQAFEWFAIRTDTQPELRQDYEALLQAFKDRYLVPLTVTDLQDLKKELKQKEDENVMDFKDRCAYVQKLEMEEIPAADRAVPLFATTRDKYTLQKFLEGLRADIKTPLLQQAAQCENLDDYLAIAKDIEISLNKKKGDKMTTMGEVAQVNTDKLTKEDETKCSLQDVKRAVEEIQTLVVRGRGRGFMNRGRGTQAGRGMNSQRRGNNCFFCGIPGHWARDCRKRQTMQRGRGTQRGRFGGFRGNNNNNNGFNNQTNGATRGNVAFRRNNWPTTNNYTNNNTAANMNNVDAHIPNAIDWVQDFQ